MVTLYDVLGVSPRAAPEDIRRAYHDLARTMHPDRARAVGADEAGAQRRMQEINDAWRVLRDPIRRNAYDRKVLGLRPARAAAETRPAVDPDGDLDDDDTPYPQQALEHGMSMFRALPWIAVGVVLLAIFVFTAYAGGNKKGDDLVGSCVSLAGGSTSEVPCEGPNDGKVALITDRASLCPGDSTARSVAGDQWLCLRPLTTVPTVAP